MIKKRELSAERILRIAAWTVSIAAIIQLALSQFTIRISRLSSAEQTGISLFAFIIFGLIAVFAVSRMKDSSSARFFSALVNFIAAFSAVWYLRMLFADEIFLRSISYTLDRHTQLLVPMTASQRINASFPLAVVILGAVVHGLAGLTILTTGLVLALKNKTEKKPEGK
jgi:uncharacterized integral membrane protein